MFKNTKQVVIIDNIKNSNIQQAIFILKDKQPKLEDYDVLDEANEIIYRYIRHYEGTSASTTKKKRRFFGRGEH